MEYDTIAHDYNCRCDDGKDRRHYCQEDLWKLLHYRHLPLKHPGPKGPKGCNCPPDTPFYTFEEFACHFIKKLNEFMGQGFLTSKVALGTFVSKKDFNNVLSSVNASGASPLHLEYTFENFICTLRGYIDTVDENQDGYLTKEDYIKLLKALEDIQNLTDRISGDEESITSNGNRLDAVDKEIVTINSDIGSINSSISTINTSIDNINGTIINLEDEITNEGDTRLANDNALNSSIVALQNKLIYFDDRFVCKSNDADGWLNWDKDAGIYFNDAHFGDMWNTTVGEDSIPLCFAVTSNGITYQYCIDAKTGRTYYRYGEFGEDALINIPWIPVGNLDTNLFLFVKSLPTEDIDDTKIYCVPNEESTEEDNILDEYYYVDGKWELFGKYAPKISLEDYFTKDEAKSLFATKDDIPTNVSELINDSGYITDSALDDYAKLSDIPAVPTNISAFVNDSEYVDNTTLTTILGSYAKTTDIPTEDEGVVSNEELSSSTYRPSATAKFITGTITRSSITIYRPSGTASSMKGHEIHMIFKAGVDTTITFYTDSEAMVVTDGATEINLSEGKYVEISIICDGSTFYARSGISNN